MSALQKFVLSRKNANIFLLSYHIRTIHKSNFSFADEVTKEKESTSENFDILEELRKPDLTEEEIMQKRFKSRLPERVYQMFIKKEPPVLDHTYNFYMNRLRAHYSRFGRASNLNPGICWPTREEILETIEYDKIFEPSLEVRVKNAEEARLAEEKRKQEVEEEVDKNMANLDKWIAEYHAKIQKKKDEQLALKQKKEKLIDEISEYLGYDIDPRDPRFQEAVEQRDREQKKARKVKKQQESYDKMISKLKQMAESK